MTRDLLPAISEEQKERAALEIEERQKIADHDIREYPIEVLIQKFHEGLEEEGRGEIYIPDYQRELVWTDEQQARFIESILFNLPIPYVFVADDEDGKSEIIDGSQRIRTIIRFVTCQLKLEGLKTLPTLNGFLFSDLPSPIMRRFKKKTIRLIEMTDRMDEEARRQMFDRLNSGGTKLKPMEQRMGSLDGEFLMFLRRVADNNLFRELCPISDARRKHREHIELVLRFFAYLDRYTSFDKRVDKFLNKYLEDLNSSGFDPASMEAEFNRMLEFVSKHFQYGFRKNGSNQSVPRIRFEAIAVGVALALRVDPELTITDVDSWLASREFGHLTRSDASNSKPKLVNRLHFVRDNLLHRPVDFMGDENEIFHDPRMIDVHQDLFAEY